MNKNIITFLAVISATQFLWGTMDNLTTILDLKQKVKTFVDNRSWDKEPGHNIKNISISIACEAAELMEIFNWRPDSDIPVIVKASTQEIKNKSADIAFALLDFCNQLNIDLAEAVDEKLVEHSKKYPADIVYKRTNDIDKSTTIFDLKAKMKKFADARNWDQSAKSTCMSIVCEAAELMEIFNWKTEAEIAGVTKEKRQDIRYEVADIAFALLSFCDELDIDLSSSMEEKIILTPKNTL